VSILSKVAFVFPGQGAQSPGMGRALYEAGGAARRSLEASARALEGSLDLLGLLFEGSEAELKRTANTHPAIAAVSLAAHAALVEALGGDGPEAMAGHSLGEWSALVAAGALDAAEALRALRLRGEAMQEAVPEGEGSMAAVLGLPGETVADLCARRSREGALVAAANFNAPAQTVIAGHTGAVEAAGEALREAGARRVQPLPVSAPFHCALMAPVQPRLASALEAMDVRAPDRPVYSNVAVEPAEDAARVRALLVEQVVAPVRWVEIVEALRVRGVETFVEVGPGRVLSGLIRRIDRSARCLNVSDPESVEATAWALRQGKEGVA
jgi:[acyl-carrier-protein] S-malonyltransferase